MRRSATCPPGWTSTRLSDTFVIDLGKMLSPSATMGGNPKPYLANRNVQWNQFELDDIGCMDFSESERNHFLLKRGDLLICEGGEIGRTAIWNAELPECYFQKAIHRLRPREASTIDSRFILHYMRHAIDWNLFQGVINQTSIAHLTREKLSSHYVDHPVSLTEQGLIAEILDSADEQIRNAESIILKQKIIENGIAENLLKDPSGTESSLDELSSPERGSMTIGPFGSNLVAADYRDSGIPVVFVQDIQSGSYRNVSGVHVSVTKRIIENSIQRNIDQWRRGTYQETC